MLVRRASGLMRMYFFSLFHSFQNKCCYCCLSSVVMFYFGAVFAFVLLLFAPTGAVDLSYVAAVYEHRLILNPDPRVPLSRLEALRHLQKNLDIFENQAARAAQQVAGMTDQHIPLMDFEPGHKFHFLFHCNIFKYLFACSFPISHKGSAVFYRTVCVLFFVFIQQNWQCLNK